MAQTKAEKHRKAREAGRARKRRALPVGTAPATPPKAQPKRRPPVKSGEPKKRRTATKRVKHSPRPAHQPLAEKLAGKRTRLAATRRAVPKALGPSFASVGHSAARAAPRLYLPKVCWRSAASLLAPRPLPSSAAARNKPARAARKLQAMAERETRELIARNEADDRGFKNALRAYNNELTRQQRIGDETAARRAALAADDEAHKVKATPARPAAAGRYAALQCERR